MASNNQENVTYHLKHDYLPHPDRARIYRRGTRIAHVSTTPLGYSKYMFPDGCEWGVKNENILRIFHTE